jgi:hypothetical protein
MGKPLLSYWKKRAPREFIEDRTTIWGNNPDLPAVEAAHIYEGVIVPNRMIRNKNVYEIVHIDELYHIHGFVVITENDMVKNIVLFGYHPNRDPDTHLYCLPERKKNVKFDQGYFDMLLQNIKTYYLDDCFYMPGKHQVKYKKLKSLYIQMNEGENNGR